jgi:hypothetical protein
MGSSERGEKKVELPTAEPKVSQTQRSLAISMPWSRSRSKIDARALGAKLWGMTNKEVRAEFDSLEELNSLRNSQKSE